jgi:hypothetical protein
MEKKAQLQSGKKYLNSLGSNAKNYNVPCDSPESQENKIPDSNQARQMKKKQEADKRRRDRQLAELEKKIDFLENRLKKLEQEMANEETLTDYKKLKELSSNHEEAQRSLDDAYNQWSAVSEVK